MDLGLLHDLAQPNTTKIILCSLDGLGGLPRPGTGKSELETAHLPNLHALATRSACGLLRHVGPGITPGSGPVHLGLFGYDPLQHPVGRGVLEALGIDFHLKPGDVAARGNFCTVDGDGRITDRRAGRIATDVCERETWAVGVYNTPVTQWNYLLAMTVITLLPVTLVFAFLQKFVTQGIASAGVK